MTVTYKNLGQATIAVASTMQDLATVGAGKSWVASSLTMVNRNASQALVRVVHRIAGAALAAGQYLVYDTSLDPGDTIIITSGWCFAATDVISIYSSVTSVDFNLHGAEYS